MAEEQVERRETVRQMRGIELQKAWKGPTEEEDAVREEAVEAYRDPGLQELGEQVAEQLLVDQYGKYLGKEEDRLGYVTEERSTAVKVELERHLDSWLKGKAQTILPGCHER